MLASNINTVHCTLYTVHRTLYTIHRTLYSVQYRTQYTVLCTLYTVHSTLYTLHSTPYSEYFTLYTVLCTTAYTVKGREADRTVCDDDLLYDHRRHVHLLHHLHDLPFRLLPGTLTPIAGVGQPQVNTNLYSFKNN